MIWSGSFSDVPTEYDIIGCYAPIYAGSPVIYHSPGRGINDSSEPTVNPGSTSGTETEYIPFQCPGDPDQWLDFAYVWFEYGNWEQNNGYFYWVTAGELCPWKHVSIAKKSCFSEGTQVVTQEGSKSIEKLKIGDHILAVSRDNPEAIPSPRRVEHVISSRERIFDVGLGGQTIHTTRNHPFYAKDKGWVFAGSLKAGDYLRSNTTHAKWVKVESINSGAESKVYSVVVDGKSAYFVGGKSWGFSILASDECSNIDTPANLFPLKDRLQATQ